MSSDPETGFAPLGSSSGGMPPPMPRNPTGVTAGAIGVGGRLPLAPGGAGGAGGAGNNSNVRPATKDSVTGAPINVPVTRDPVTGAIPGNRRQEMVDSHNTGLPPESMLNSLDANPSDVGAPESAGNASVQATTSRGGIPQPDGRIETRGGQVANSVAGVFDGVPQDHTVDELRSMQRGTPQANAMGGGAAGAKQPQIRVPPNTTLKPGENPQVKFQQEQLLEEAEKKQAINVAMDTARKQSQISYQDEVNAYNKQYAKYRDDVLVPKEQLQYKVDGLKEQKENLQMELDRITKLRQKWQAAIRAEKPDTDSAQGQQWYSYLYKYDGMMRDLWDKIHINETATQKAQTELEAFTPSMSEPQMPKGPNLEEVDAAARAQAEAKWAEEHPGKEKPEYFAADTSQRPSANNDGVVLRGKMAEAGKETVAQSYEDKVLQEMLFSSFGYVHKNGWLGNDSCVYVDGWRNDNQIRMKAPLCFKTFEYNHGLHPLPRSLAANQSDAYVKQCLQKCRHKPHRKRAILRDARKHPQKYKSALAQDYNSDPPATCAPYSKPSVMKYRIRTEWKPRQVFDPAGIHLNKLGTKSRYNTWNKPWEKVDSEPVHRRKRRKVEKSLQYLYRNHYTINY